MSAQQRLLFKPLNSSERAPLYRQVQENLRTAVIHKAFVTDEQLPNERLIAERLSVSRVTVRKAIAGLVDEGLLERRQGAGTFVVNRIEKNFAKLSSFSEDMKSRGRQSKSKVVSKEFRPATGDAAFQLGLNVGASVARIERLRFADDEPLAIEFSILPAHILNHSLDIGPSLYAYLEKHGNRPVRAIQKLRAENFSGDIAQRLNVSSGAAGLRIERRGFLEDGAVAEHTVSYYRGDAYDFIAELQDNSPNGSSQREATAP